MSFFDMIRQPWPWYVAGPLIGLTVPLLLIMGNRFFGISSTLRHVCAACIPGNISFFKYDWKKEAWNLLFAAGIVIGGILAAFFMKDQEAIQINPQLAAELSSYGVTDYHSLVPADVFNWQALLTPRGFILIVIGGFMVGFGTRYAGGCTSGHSIMGLSNLQLPSLIATLSFMAGGFIVANLLIPVIMKL